MANLWLTIASSNKAAVNEEGRSRVMSREAPHSTHDLLAILLLVYFADLADSNSHRHRHRLLGTKGH